MRIDCVDENGRLQEAAFTKILEAASEVFRQEFNLPAEEEERMEVSLTITDEETIRQINREYRDIDRVTDVLSFPQYESAEAVAEELKSLDILTAVAKARGCLKKGEELDYEKASRLLLEEFRSGKLGKVTLEFPKGTEEA